MNKLFTKIAGLTLGLAMAIGVGVAAGSKKEVASVHAEPENASVSISERAGTLNWSNGVAYSGWTDTSGIFTFTQTGGGNNGKYYTSDTSWRFYTGGTVGISCSSDYEILSVTSTPSKTFTIATDKHSASHTLTANTKFTAFTISYQASGGATYYGVTYDSNNATSGTVPTDSKSYESGDTVTVLGNTGNLCKTGYIWSGWNTADDGTGTDRAAGSTFEISADTTLFAKWTADTLNSLSIAGSMTKTNYKEGDNWSPNGFTVTANYQSGATPDVTNDVTWSYYVAGSVQETAALGDTSVVVRATFGGKYIESSSQSVVVAQGVTYDLSKIKGFSSWTNTYGAHDLTEASFNPAVGVAASLNFLITNKQSSGDVGTKYPCIGGKTTTEVTCLTFTLNEPDKKISSVDITFVTRYTSTYPTLYLHKGNGIGTSAVNTLTMSGAVASEHTLSYDNLNDTIFTVGYNANQTSSNGAVGIKSISIGLAQQATFGTLDHIKVTSLPNVVYHVGENYDATGFAVTAYDGADEATANFKDVTSSVTTSIDDGDVLTEGLVPGFDVEVEYAESEITKNDTFYVYVYALAEYELVTSEPADWSGNYLIVGTNADSELAAMNGGLENPDVEAGYKVVADTDGVIEAGQELEWTIAPISGGYSIQGKSGKYIGSLTTNANGMLVSNDAMANTISFSGENATIKGTNNYSLTLHTTADRFRYYSGSNSVKLYKLVESDKADAFAQAFLGAFTCDNSGLNKPSFADKEPGVKWTWALLEEAYNTLNPTEKEQFRTGAASETGTNIQKALARYDYVVGKYFVAELDKVLISSDFMNRTPSPVGSARLSSVDSDNMTATIVVIVSMATITLLGACLILRKRREQR